MEQTLISYSEKETMDLAKVFAKSVDVGDIICLEGELGAGKTHFVKGFVSAFGIDPDDVTSPTFAIIQEYHGEIPVYHFDFYRIEKKEEALEIGAEEYFYNDGVCIIEWPDRVKDLIPEKSIYIRIKQTGPETRSIQMPRVV
jgi:tRNA threonylcarbamoyladenosine biosynthesis protein TsaE